MRVPLSLVVFMTLGAGVPFVVLTGSGLAYAPAGVGGTITASASLVFSMMGGWVILGEQPLRRAVAGTVMVLLGLLVLAGALPGDVSWRGYPFFLGGGFLWAIYTVAARSAGIAPIHATAIVAVLSMLLYLPPYFALAGLRMLDAGPRDLILQALGQGILTGILALLLHTKAVASLGAGRGAMMLALVPCFTVLLAFLFLGETPSGLEVLSIGVVFMGMLLSLLPTRPARAEARG